MPAPSPSPTIIKGAAFDSTRHWPEAGLVEEASKREVDEGAEAVGEGEGEGGDTEASEFTK